MTKRLTVSEIADAVDGRLVGDGALLIERLAHPADALSKGDLVLAMDKNLLSLLAEKNVSAVVVSEEAELDEGPFATRIIIKRPRLAMAKLTNLFAEEVKLSSGIHPSAVIEPDAKVGANVCIGANTYVGSGAAIGDNSVLHPQAYVGPGVTIGSGALIYSGVRIGARVQIGARCIIHFNASIGADGFSFVTPEIGSVEAAKATGTVAATNQTLVRIASLGSVILGDDVEIGANTSIDRGTIASTRIGNGTKIDNQVQVGHNVVIGDNCLICGRVGIAGSVIVGNRVVLGGAVGIADHVKVGDDVVAMAMSGIAGNVPAKTVVGGAPAKPRNQVIEEQFNLRRLKSLMRKVESLTERLETLEKGGKTG